MNIIALIPARSGSKGIINKNIKLYKGIPLIAHSIKIALQCEYINDVYVSTDSLEYQRIALEYGAKVTSQRPPEISNDLSPDIDTFTFFLDWLKKENIKIPDIIIHLRPTYPNRNMLVLNDCIEIFIKEYMNYDSLRTVVNLKKTPYKMYYIENNILVPYIKTHPLFKEPYNQARQNFPETYLHNGCIDIIKTEIIIKRGELSGETIYPYLMDDDEINDIDDITDFITAEKK
jgi:N-acylneuraminate cytidylyltransferase